ncbi:glycosyltransferase family 2 protein [Chromobacterium haemolyticum]|uniref:glycosyltransferase family 2 protein n=1 Tax=Chromobacterium TaxID=535 RepID=UPI004056B2FA
MISVVIPAYNYAQYLPDTLNSILRQGIDDLEIIVCDDCSTDNTAEVIQKFAAKDPRVKYYLNDKNLGATLNINQAVKKASGDYIVLVGADDMLAPNSLKTLKEALDQHPECGFVYGRYTLINENNQHFPLQHPGWLDHDYFGERDELPNLLTFDCYINIVASMFRREIVLDEDFFDTSLQAFDDEPFFRATDWDKSLRLAEQGIKIGFVNKNISIFRVHQQQASSGDKYGRSGLALFEHALLLERYFTTANLERLLPRLADIIRLFQSKFEYFHSQALPEFAHRRELAEARANEVLSKVESVLSKHAQQGSHDFTESQLPEASATTLNPEHPFFSIVFTTYDRPHLAINALQSIAAQSFKDFEVILVNDGGLPQESLMEWLGSEINVTYVRQPNRGVASARNLALRLCRGQYVVYLDDDDIMYNHHLARLHHEATRHPGALVFGNAHFITEQVQCGMREEQGRALMACKQFDFNRLQISNYIPINALAHPLLVIDEVGGFDETLASHEDWDLLIRLSRKIPFAHFNDITVQVRRRLGNGQEFDSRTVRAWQSMKQDFMEIYSRYDDMGIEEIKKARAKVMAADHPTQAGLNFN